TLVGTAAADGTYGKKSQLSFDIKNAHLESKPSNKLVGVIGVSGFGENMVFRGDTVVVQGKLREGTGSHQGWMSFAQLQVAERETSLLEKVRHEFGAGMMTALPEPLASFGMGILIGQRSTLPDEVYQDLLMVGLVHIIAVSGYNLTIILRACWRLLGNRSKYQTLILSVALIGTFLLITGASASIVRASIISGLSIVAWYYGRTFKPVTLILLAAAITAFASPLYLWSDLGWYLSFLAFYGVLVLAPQIRYRWIPDRWRDSMLLCIALESLCAEIMTLPLILYIFGQMSHVSLLANVVIATFVPIAMLLALLAGIAGTLLMPVVGWVAWPAVIVLTYMLDAAHLLASIPGIFVEHIGFSLAAMVGMYAVVLGFNLALHSRLRRNRAIITALNEEHTLLQPSYQSAVPTR
ncbi:MAG: hypothetical protein JWP13_894, partial [Candidatus Saccharibacteria bacterium]|nr:hypothetical protein [Candidatus Saccharibacteria bacterium]